jgi:hypothetical protein
MKTEDPLSAAVRRRKRKLTGSKEEGAAKALTWTEKGKLVREVLGPNAFDPWQRLGEKAGRGLDINVEARYLETTGIKPVTPEGTQMRERYLEQVATKDKPTAQQI